MIELRDVIPQLPAIFDQQTSDYHTDSIDPERPSISASIIHTLCTTSPAHARAAHPKLNPNLVREDDEKFDIGNVVHALLLQGETITEICPFDSWRTNAAKEQRDAARAQGRVPLLAKDADRVTLMYQAIVEQLAEYDLDVPLLADGKPEQTVVWEDDDVLCRARIDWLRDDRRAIDDVKTTSRSANPESWTRNTMYQIGAHVQVAFYLRGMAAAAGLRPEWRYLLCETQPPFAVSVVTPGPSVIALADRQIDWALAKWRECLASGEWPAYSREVFRADLMSWEEQRWLEREAREEVAA